METKLGVEERLSPAEVRENATWYTLVRGEGRKLGPNEGKEKYILYWNDLNGKTWVEVVDRNAKNVSSDDSKSELRVVLSDNLDFNISADLKEKLRDEGYEIADRGVKLLKPAKKPERPAAPVPEPIVAPVREPTVSETREATEAPRREEPETSITKHEPKVEQPPSLETILENAASDLREKGIFSFELTGSGVEDMIRQALELKKEELEKKGLSVEKLENLSVSISGEKALVALKAVISRKVGFLRPSMTVSAEFVLENASSGKEDERIGELETKDLKTSPESIPFVGKLSEQINPYLGGRNINRSFRDVLTTELGNRNTELTSAQLMLTDKSTLRVKLEGRSK